MIATTQLQSESGSQRAETKGTASIEQYARQVGATSSTGGADASMLMDVAPVRASPLQS